MDAEVSGTANFEHLLLAAECVYDTGPARLQGNLLGEVRSRLQSEADARSKRASNAQTLRKLRR